MLAERPRFRNDLVAQPIEEEGVRYVDVTDPNSGSTFRFYDVEYSIACAMDGAKDIHGLVEWTRAELGIETSQDELASVVNTLADLGYLEAAAAAAAAAEGGNGAVHGDETAAEVAAAYDQVMEISAPSAHEVETAGHERLEADDLEPKTHVFNADEQAKLVAETAKRTQPPVDDEMSFEGLIDEASRTGIPAVPPAPAATHAASRNVTLGDDEPTRIPAPKVDDDEDDMGSVDLSAHLTVDREDVAEAVRSSRVLSVPAIPRELLEESAAEADEPTALRALAEARSTEPVETPSLAAAQALAAPPPPPTHEEADVTPPPLPPIPVPGARAADSAIPLPSTRPQASKPIELQKQPPPATKAPAKKGSSAGLMVVLVVLVAAVVGVYAFKDKIFGKDEAAAGQPTKPPPKPPTTQAGTTPPAPKTPPPPPSAKLRSEGGSVDAAATQDGELAWVVENGAKVAAGEPIAKFAGFQKAEKDLDRAQKLLVEHSDRLAYYTEKQNPTKIAEKQALVDADKKAIAAAEQALAQSVVKAPVAGDVQLLAGKGAKVKAGDPIVRIGGDPQLVASFTVDKAALGGYEAGAACIVAAKASRDKELACVVDTVDAAAATVNVRLVPGSAAAEGDEVVLLPKK